MKTLYKFIADPSAVSFLLRGMIKFTPVPELNDPSELTPNIITEEVKRSLDRLRKDGYTETDMINLRRQKNLLRRLSPQFHAGGLPETPNEATAQLHLPYYDQIATLEQQLNELVLAIAPNAGGFCSSLRYDSLPMWAHYANNATGLVIEFVDLERVFQGDDTGVLSQPIAVRYERDRLSVSFETRSHESIFFAKFPDWSYEREVRIVLPLADCRKEPKENSHIYIREIPRGCIARLILGWRLPLAVRKVIRDQVQEFDRDVEIVDASVVRGRVMV